VHPGAGDHRGRLAAGAGGAAEHEILRLEQRPDHRRRLRGAACGQRLAGQRREVEHERAVDDPGVGGDAVALGDDQDVARYEVGGLDLAPHPVAHHPGGRGEERGQRVDGPFGLPLLHEGERGVEQDHGEHRERQRGRPAHPRQHRRHTQQHHQRLGELLQQITGPARATLPGQLVRPIDDQPARSLPPGQASGRRPQVAEELGKRTALVGMLGVVGSASWRPVDGACHDGVVIAVAPR